jgi:hypothetical protein
MRLFYMAPTGSLTLRRLTLQGGVARGATGGGEHTFSFIGGGGGGAGLGGAIFNRGVLSVEASTLIGNQAIGGDGGSGGIWRDPSTNPFAVGGGGGGALQVASSPVGGNGGFGGGGGSGSNGFFGLGGFGGGRGGDWPTNSGYGGGGAGLGGAIFSDAGSANIVNSTLVGNSALGGWIPYPGAGLGGAVFSRNGSLTVRNSTLVGNITDALYAEYWDWLQMDYQTFGLASGGGIFVVGDGATATVNLNNTIIAKSTVELVQAFDYTAISIGSAGSALSQSGSNNLIELSYGFGGPPVLNPHPQLGPLQDNGGPTWTMAPAAGSPAIDAIPAPGNGAPATDQRGVARPYGAGIDIGAVEVAPAPTITSAMPGSGIYGTGYSHSFTATGGIPIRYSITDGSLLPGLTLDGSTGQLGGTPTQAGSFGPITVTASNAIGSATQSVTIEIAPATLTITADANTRTYGEANPALTYTVGSLVNGDTAETVLTGALATTATASSPPGSYDITQGSLAANANYTIRFTGATLTVAAAADNTYDIYLPMVIR